MKLEIIKDGEIQGSYVALALTIMVFTFLGLGFVYEDIRTSWERIGNMVITLYLGQFASWLAYKGAKSIFSSSTPQQEIRMVTQPQQPQPQQPKPVIGPITIQPTPLQPAPPQTQKEVVMELK